MRDQRSMSRPPKLPQEVPSILRVVHRSWIILSRDSDVRLLTAVSCAGQRIIRGQRCGPSSVRKLVSNHLAPARIARSEEHTSELQSLMRISYAVFCLKKKQP